MKTLKERAAWCIDTFWIYSAYWDKRAKKYNAPWEEIALQDCKKRIHQVEDELQNLENIRNELEIIIKK